jgi:hypothetical protein
MKYGDLFQFDPIETVVQPRHADKIKEANSDWDYRYVLVAPRRSFDWRLTHYSWVVTQIADQIEAYRRVLEELAREPDSPVILDRLRSFNDFCAKSIANVRRVTWEDLIAALGPGRFSPIGLLRLTPG